MAYLLVGCEELQKLDSSIYANLLRDQLTPEAPEKTRVSTCVSACFGADDIRTKVQVTRSFRPKFPS